jgi:hypothetical protein
MMMMMMTMMMMMMMMMMRRRRRRRRSVMSEVECLVLFAQTCLSCTACVWEIRSTNF